VSVWPSTKARIVYKALQRIGWQFSHQVGSHKKLKHADFPEPYTWSFEDGEELGPRILARIAKKTGLKPSDL
jgi:predicted RNA binding protein YcfA (HicA-like mRNA interferase family)